MSVFTAQKAFSISPDDDAILTVRPKAIYVGSGGDVAVIMAHDDPDDSGADVIIFKDVPTGTTLQICVKRVLDAGTDADELVGLV